MSTTGAWNPLQHGAFEYDNLGESHPLRAVMHSRYIQDPDFRDHVHRSLVDPQYALHHLRMRNDKNYANRYLRNTDFRDSVHAKMKDPLFAQHQYRMRTNKGYAKAYTEQQQDRAAHDDGRAYPYQGPSLKQVIDHLRGSASWSPKPAGPAPGTVGAPLPAQRSPESGEDDFEPFPEPKTPTFRDDGKGNLITARSSR